MKRRLGIAAAGVLGAGLWVGGCINSAFVEASQVTETTAKIVVQGTAETVAGRWYVKYGTDANLNLKSSEVSVAAGLACDKGSADESKVGCNVVLTGLTAGRLYSFQAFVIRPNTTLATCNSYPGTLSGSDCHVPTMASGVFTTKGSCLSRANVVTGVYPGSGTWAPSAPMGSTLNMSSVTLAKGGWLVTPHSAESVCFYGGSFKNSTSTEYADGGNSFKGPDGGLQKTSFAAGDIKHDGGRALAGEYNALGPWEQIWHRNGGFTMTYEDGGRSAKPNSIFDSVSIQHTGDAFNLWRSSDNFIIRNSYLADIRDDCVQNDFFYGGEIHNNLFNGCYSGISLQGSYYADGGVVNRDASKEKLQVYNNLIYIKPMPTVFKGDFPGSAFLFKWDTTGATADLTPKLVFRNNVVRIDKLPFQVGNSPGAIFPTPPGAVVTNNTLLWGSPLPVPAELQALFSADGGNQIIRNSDGGTEVEANWAFLVQAWKNAHPNVVTQ